MASVRAGVRKSGSNTKPASYLTIVVERERGGWEVLTLDPQPVEFADDDEPQELDTISLDVRDIPSEVLDLFSGLPVEDLNSLAWKPASWSPGTLERQIVYQLRVIFNVDFTGLGGSQIFHPDDNPMRGTGTFAEEKRGARV